MDNENVEEMTNKIICLNAPRWRCTPSYDVFRGIWYLLEMSYSEISSIIGR